MWFRRSAVEWILVRVWKEREIREQKAGALPDREDSDRETWSFRPSFVPWQKPGKRWGRYSFCLLEEGSLLSISRSSCIGAQRAVGKTLTGLSGTISYTRYLLLLLMSRYYHSCICICVTVIVTIKLFKFQVSFKTFQKSVWKTSITTMAMTCIWPLMNSRERWQGGVTDGQ